jgi:hypothetical protein
MSSSGSAIIRALSSKKRTDAMAESAQPTRRSASFARFQQAMQIHLGSPSPVDEP